MEVPHGGETQTNPSHPNPPSLLFIHCTIVEWHMYLYTPYNGGTTPCCKGEPD